MNGGQMCALPTYEGQFRDPAEQALEDRDLLGKADMTVLLAESLLDLPQVGSGAEDLLIAADVEDRGLAMRVDPVEQLAETGDPFVVDRIYRRARKGDDGGPAILLQSEQIGRASGRERVCKYV